MTIEAMKLALEVLELFCEYGIMDRPIERREALRQAIAEAEKQEPVAWVERDGELVWNNKAAAIGRNLYTHPQQAVGAAWKGLTAEEIWKIYFDLPSDDSKLSDLIGFARAIAAKLKEKNT